MTRDAEQYERVFKTAWFAKAAKKADIRDAELCTAIRQVMLGQADDLGGGGYKKRLGKNLYRSIIVARGARYWVYEFLFAKQDVANIPERKLMELRLLAKTYAMLSMEQIDAFLDNKDWMEICYGNKAQL